MTHNSIICMARRRDAACNYQQQANSVDLDLPLINYEYHNPHDSSETF